MRLAWFTAAVALGACGSPSDHFEIQWILERGDAQMCPFNDCSLISMACDAAVMVRIVDADDEDTVYLSECFEVAGGGDLCALEGITLPDDPIPNTMVKIQVAIWPYDAASADCPEVVFDQRGQVSVTSPTPRPAIAGEAYFAVGSGEVAAVTLGCVNVEALDTACRADDTVDVDVSVDDIDTRVSVPPQVGSRLAVAVGEPRFDAELLQYVMTNDESVGLIRTFVDPPLWQGDDLELSLEESVCVQVLEGVVQATATLHCDVIDGDEELLALSGVLVDTALIDEVADALGGIPDEGLVLGLVVDAENEPTAGATVEVTNGATVLYLSEDHSTVVEGATATTASGMFVSIDAPYAIGNQVTTWTVDGLPGVVAPGHGGQVEAKVTVVLLQLQDPVIEP
jgi:hypothetical protein